MTRMRPAGVVAIVLAATLGFGALVSPPGRALVVTTDRAMDAISDRLSSDLVEAVHPVTKAGVVGSLELFALHARLVGGTFDLGVLPGRVIGEAIRDRRNPPARAVAPAAPKSSRAFLPMVPYQATR